MPPEQAFGPCDSLDAAPLMTRPPLASRDRLNRQKAADSVRSPEPGGSKGQGRGRANEKHPRAKGLGNWLPECGGQWRPRAAAA
jgi:hypothetical protein